MKFKAETLLEKAIVPVFVDAGLEQELVKAMFGEPFDKDDITERLDRTFDQNIFLELEEIERVSYWEESIKGAALRAAQLTIAEEMSPKDSLIDALHKEIEFDEIEVNMNGRWCLQDEESVVFYSDLYTCLSKTTAVDEGLKPNIDNLYKLYDEEEIENIAIKTVKSGKTYESLVRFTHYIHDKLGKS